VLVLPRTNRSGRSVVIGRGLHAVPHALDLAIATLAVDIDAQSVQDSEPFVAVFLILGIF
tara:strand:+ start:338 stop:517 length:180 start_codon:yes stop_codon:yes gene_type:complete